ncbi:hypothetical protein [Streptomyces pseudovenezuelae]|uniref:Uncharacterized protein n=1 Tax=Streptomyces pseudovenezuelae TaxID=67350 RepID=A0ABT6LPQ8_9ACTN|nr:hypothetical protein [Streptomyces pseudovenezuelae]MDH6218232.1 hypothetical protein [Streptomyces pseudovenezuelae]
MSTRGALLTAAAVLTAGVPVAAWGLMGQQDADGFSASELDYTYGPSPVTDGIAALIGAFALVLVAAAGALLVRAADRGALDRRWWGVLAPLVVAGLIVGVGLRILTAGVIGANIGAGLTIVLGGPVVAALVLWALGRGWWLATRHPDGDNRGDGGGRSIRIASHGA